MPSQRRREKLRKLRMAAREKQKMDAIYEEARILKCTVAGQAIHLEEEAPPAAQTWSEWWTSFFK